MVFPNNVFYPWNTTKGSQNAFEEPQTWETYSTNPNPNENGLESQWGQ